MTYSENIEDLYLAGQIADAAVLDHFQATRKHETRNKGAVYTPEWIVHAMLARIGLISRHQTIIEPACGHGSLVLPLIRYARNALGMSWPETCEWFRTQVTCIDLDPDVVADLRSIVAHLFQREGVSADPESFTNILAADGLKVPSRPWDIAIGNPPYIRTQGLDPEYLCWLRKSFEVARRGNIDIYYAFLDLYVAKSRRAVFIVPNGWIGTVSAQSLRERIGPRISEIVDFRDRLVFPNARTYTCILTADRDHDGDLIYRNGLEDPGRLRSHGELGARATSPTKQRALSGIATLCDKVFHVRRQPDGNFIGHVGGKDFPVESALVRPLIKVTQMEQSPSAEWERFIIFPYTGYGGSAVIPEQELASSYPLAHAYLRTARPLLEARDSGKARDYPVWYAYGRTQGLHDMADTTAVFVPRIIGGRSVPRLFDTTELTAMHGAPLFVSGFAIRCGARARDALLGPAFRRHVEACGSPKPGKSETYYAISSRHLNAFLAHHS